MFRVIFFSFSSSSSSSPPLFFLQGVRMPVSGEGGRRVSSQLCACASWLCALAFAYRCGDCRGTARAPSPPPPFYLLSLPPSICMRRGRGDARLTDGQCETPFALFLSVRVLCFEFPSSSLLSSERSAPRGRATVEATRTAGSPCECFWGQCSSLRAHTVPILLVLPILVLSFCDSQC